MPSQPNLADMFDDILKECKGSKITIGQMIEALNHKGFGTLLLIPTIINLLPTGAIPGVPAVCNTVIILICVQMLMGRSSPWMPKWVNNLSLGRKKFEGAIKKIKPVLKFIDRFTVRRFAFLSSKIVAQIIALICIALASISFFLEFIPLAAYPPALAIFIFALGLTIKDGVLTVVGFIIAGINLVVIPSWIF